MEAIAQNRREDYRYQMAQHLLLSKNQAAAKAALDDLYRVAPYYGDPAGVAKEAGLAVLPSLKEVVSKRTLDRYDTVWLIGSAIVAIFVIPANFLAVTIISAAMTGVWWRGSMLINSLYIALIELGISALVFTLGRLITRSQRSPHNASASLFWALLLPNFLLGGIAYVIYYGLASGVNFGALRLIAGGGLVAVVVEAILIGLLIANGN